MGAWGTGSFENDTAMDFISDLVNFKSIGKIVLKKKIDTEKYDEVRVAAEILLHLNKINDGFIVWTEQEVIDGMIEYLNFLLLDKDWLATWDNGGRDIKKDVRRLIRGLEKVEGC